MTTPGSHAASTLLRAIPALVGFEPREALVVVGLTRANATGMVFRVDRAECLLTDVASALGRSIAVHLARAGLRQACIVSYRDGALDEPDPAVERLANALEDVVEVRDAWVVCDGRFRSQWCTDYACCPRRGVPFGPDPDASRAGVFPAASRGRSATDPDARRRALRAKQRAIAARHKQGPAWDLQAYALWRDAVEEALDGRMPSDAVAGRLLAGLEVAPVRDAIIVDLDGAGDAACADVLAGRADGRVKESLWSLVQGRPTRDTARVEAAVDLSLYLASVAAGARNGANAAPMTVAAIGHWWLGDAAAAHHLTDAALAAQPDYRLAQLVGATLMAGLGPT
jgi:hypothetical protein